MPTTSFPRSSTRLEIRCRPAHGASWFSRPHATSPPAHPIPHGRPHPTRPDPLSVWAHPAADRTDSRTRRRHAGDSWRQRTAGRRAHALDAHPETFGAWMLEVTRPEPSTYSPGGRVPRPNQPHLPAHLQATLRPVLGLTVHVRLQPPGSLPTPVERPRAGATCAPGPRQKGDAGVSVKYTTLQIRLSLLSIRQP